MKYKGIIFDLDGVICFTDKYHYLAWKRLADKLGIYFDETINNRLRGVSRMESLEIILEKSTKKYSKEEKEDFAEQKNKMYVELLEDMTPADLPKEVKTTLDDLRKQGVLLAIGSSSKNAKRILKHLGLENYFDAISDGTHAFVPAVMEHIELAGVHSGDSACIIPSVHISEENVKTIKEYTRKIAEEMHVKGLMNMQYAIEKGKVFVLEANPRASRTVPLVSKVCNIKMVKLATDIMTSYLTGRPSPVPALKEKKIPHYGVKMPVFPFKMFPEVDPVLGPEMRSTGEVMGFDRDFPHAFAKSQLAAYDGGLPTHGNVFISVNDTDKRQLPLIAVRLEELGFKLWATEGTASVLRRYGIESNIVDKISTRVDTDPEAPVEVHHAAGSVGKNVVQLIEEGKIDMILNTPNSRGSRSDGYSIRAAAIAADLPQFTTITEFQAALLAIEAVKHNDYQIMSIQEHSKQLFELERREF